MKIKIAITAVAWATAAYYSFAWWMGGANIGFVVASTSQAVALAKLTNETRNEINFLTETVDKIKRKLKRQNSETLFKLIKDFLKKEFNKNLKNLIVMHLDLFLSYISKKMGPKYDVYGMLKQIASTYADMEFFYQNIMQIYLMKYLRRYYLLHQFLRLVLLYFIAHHEHHLLSLKL
ncbi:hypothetical protein NX779_02960 [Mycoplasma cottewii]|uniref:Uncharacterized protein n=1 Tax=Mycoplasma cottewii TaxID=51364 RepID=A0ABY5TX21_9MOLU|nr:hypothetical protein [Mycoplasma cottewii]UWD34750.1 hypothetical protein NX779_02960 [Mycoplasma cottewii]